MSELRRCPQCNAEIPADTPAGLCPQCLLKAANESQSNSGFGPTKLTPPNTGFVPPTIDEVAELLPQLEILELLGKGGMGAVYKARQRQLDRLVAVKILPSEISHDPAFAERFTREARALARLSHPQIVAVYDFGVVGQAGKPDLRAGLYYIVMEFVDGTNLRETIRAGKLAAAEALAIVPQICDALQFAHDEGIVHRDIKPENILIDKRGRVKIADFGLAKLLGQDASDHALTATHQVMGTLRYMAPEQMQGAREVDHRADIYSLGVVFYELLTGELPMGKFAPPSKKVQVDVRLDEIVLRALEQEPEQRYQHASEIKTDVDTISRSPSVAPSQSTKGVVIPAQIAPTPFDDSGRVTQPRRWWLLPRTVTLLSALVGGLAVAGPWQSVEIRAPFTQGNHIQWFLPKGYESGLGLAAGVLFAIAFFMTLAAFPLRRATLPAVTILLGLVITALMTSYGYHPPLMDRPEVADVVAQIHALNPNLLTEGTTDLDFVLAAREAKFIQYWQIIIPAFYVCLGMALVTVLAATFDFVLLRQAAAVEPSHKLEAATGKQLVQAPADCLLLAAGIAFVTVCGVAIWLAEMTRRGNDLTTPLVRGNLTVALIVHTWYYLLIGVAGLLLRRLRARLFVLLAVVIAGLFLPAVVALNVVMEFPRMPEWPVAIPLWLGMPAALWVVVMLFRDDVRRAFDAKCAASQISDLPRDVSPGPPNEQVRELTHDGSPGVRAERPALVYVLASIDLVVAVVLTLLCTWGDHVLVSATESWLWHAWGISEIVLGLIGSAGLFVAGIALLLWKPWARRLTLGVCFFGLAALVIDIPYLFHAVIPATYEEILRQEVAHGRPAEDAAARASLGVLIGFGGLGVVGLSWLIGHLVYFTRPRVVAAFERPRVSYGKFLDWLFTGGGSLAGALSVFVPLALLVGLGSYFSSSTDRTTGRLTVDVEDWSMRVEIFRTGEPKSKVHLPASGQDRRFDQQVPVGNYNIVGYRGDNATHHARVIVSPGQTRSVRFKSDDVYLDGEGGLQRNTNTRDSRSDEVPAAGLAPPSSATLDPGTTNASIHIAAEHGDVTRVKQLIDAGASLNAKDAEGQTPLMKAVARGHKSLALTLIVLGADLAEQDLRGRTAEMIAVEKRDATFLSRVQALSQISYDRDPASRKERLRSFAGIEHSLLAGRDVDLAYFSPYDAERLQDVDGENALMKAARAGDWECFNLLATQLHTMQAQDKLGRTVLMHAVLGGHAYESRWKEQIEWLTKPPYFGIAGVDNIYVGAMVVFELERSLSVLDRDGRSVVQLAEQHQQPEVARILRRHLEMVITNQTAEIAKGSDSVAKHHRLCGLAWQALGDQQQAEAEFKKATTE